MNFVAIGRSDVLFNSIKHLVDLNHELVAIITDHGAKEYSKQIIDFEELARKYRVPFLVTNASKTIDDFLNSMKHLDIGISVNHRRILGKSTIDLFKHGILNFHGGDLPRYRGNACQAWAIINGESKIGACVYKMEPDFLDAGRILSRKYFELTEQTKIADCLGWLTFTGPDLFAESINKLEKNSSFVLENSLESTIPSLRCFERRPQDGLIDWQREPQDIVRLVNASGPPYFGAFSYLDGKLIKILEARIGSFTGDYCAIQGQVIHSEKERVLIACGKGVLEVSKIEYDGVMVNAQDVLSSTRLRLESSNVALY